MATIQLLIGGSALAPTASNKLKKKKEIAEATVKDNSVTIDRVLAARMRDATVQEMHRLARMEISYFRQMMQWQGNNVSKFSDSDLRFQIDSQVADLRYIAIQLLKADLFQAETPMIIAGSPQGLLGMVTKVLGPTFVGGQMPLGIAVWWNCDRNCKIDTIHYGDKNVSQVIKL